MSSVEITKKAAIRVFGSQSNLARALKVTRQAVSKVPDGALPELWQMKLRYEIRPDVWGNKRKAA